MTVDEIKIWLLDTISEGGYSFKEIDEYVARHGVYVGDLSNILTFMLDDRLIDVELRLGDDKYVSLDVIEARRCIADMSFIILEESNSHSAHYFQITTAGRAVLDGMGINEA